MNIFFRQVYHGIGDQLAVAVLGLEGERDGLADLLAQDCLLEFGKQHACPEDEFERLVPGATGLRFVRRQ